MLPKRIKSGHQRLHPVLLLILCLLTSPTYAQPSRILDVGPGHPYPTLTAAAAAQQNGDHIRIAPGLYQECAIWHASNLVIEGAGMEKTVIADRPCQGKALFITQGHNITIRHLTFARSHVPDQNGAGIRAQGGPEGGDLTIEHVQFEDSENGILSHHHPTARITIRDSRFLRNGFCGVFCAHGIYINNVALLRVERSYFFEQRTGHHIKSRARATEIIDTEIDDRAEGTASYLIDLPHGGHALIRNNRLRKGPRTENAATAIMIGTDPGHHPTTIRIESNHFHNDGPLTSALVENRTTAPAQLTNNHLTGPTIPLRLPPK